MQILTSRRDVGIKLLDAVPIRQLSNTARSTIQTQKDKLTHACSHCLEDLGKTLWERKMLKGEAARILPRWQEPSLDVMTLLCHQAAPNTTKTTRVGLHLSNILKYDFTRSPQAVDVETTRRLHAQLCGPSEGIENALGQLQCSELTTWAPADNGQSLQVASAMQSLAGRNGRTPKLVLAVPIDPYPGCEKVSDVLDLWRHPLLATRWRGIVQAVTILTPPSRMILSGQHAPMHRMKALVLFTLQVTAQTPTYQMLNWRNVLYEYDVGPVVVVGVPGEETMMAAHLLKNMQVPGLLHIYLHRPSLGMTANAPRSAIHIHLARETATPLVLEMTMQWLRKELHSASAVIGCVGTVASATAMLMDLPAAAAAFAHAEGCWSLMVVSPRLTPNETHMSEDWWRHSQTEAWNADPSTAGEKNRFRPSSNNKGSFANVCATPEQIRVARAQKARPDTSSDITKYRAIITIEVGTAGLLCDWLPACMGRISQSAGLVLQASQETGGLDIHRWHPVRDFDGRWTQLVQKRK